MPRALLGGPINTRTGGYDYTRSDISIHTSLGELAFQREYTSLSVSNPTPLSSGWTHNHDTRLIFPTDPEGQPSIVLFKAHTANKYLFTINSNGTYTPYPGLCAKLTFTQGLYVLKDSGQKTYTFNISGKLLTYADAQGHEWDYVYDTNGRLDRVNADGGKFLKLDYDAQGRIASVNDHTNRTVTYHYNADNDLDSVEDMLGQIWTYEYHPTLNHILTRAAAPGDVTIERTEYYSDGRAWKQFDGEDNLVVELIYNVNDITTIKDAFNHTETHTYDARGTLIAQEDAAGGAQQKQYDLNFRPATITDANGDTTTLTWSADGANLTQIVDAEGNQTDIAYNSLNLPTSVIDPRGFLTTFDYNDTLLTSRECPL